METLLAALKAVAEPTRLRIFSLCAHSDLTVTDLTQLLGQSQPRVSRHLRLLCEAGLLERFQEGSWAYFRLSGDGPAAELARHLVDQISPDDPTFKLDLERLEGVMASREKLAADYFRRNAVQWDELRSLHAKDTEVERALIDLLMSREVGELLDIGTGTGRIIEILAPHVQRAVGIDRSREMLAVARSKLERAKLRHCVVRQADMYHIPLPPRSFDAITIHQVLHFAERPAQAIAEAARVLRPGGRLVIVDFERHANESLRTEHAHRWLGFDGGEIRGWCEAAGLVTDQPISLTGGDLTVGIWPASRPAHAA